VDHDVSWKRSIAASALDFCKSGSLVGASRASAAKIDIGPANVQSDRRSPKRANHFTVKSALQVRAEEAAKRFGNARKPIVLEFAGVPKAGKTSTIGALQAFLKRCGFKVQVVGERAAVCPIRDKTHPNFNVWTVCTTLVEILEKTQDPPREDDPQILILDRGLFDSLCWLTLMEKLGRVRHREYQILENFLRIDDWRKRISAVFVMTVTPRDALKREGGLLPVEIDQGGIKEGSVMNKSMLDLILRTTAETAERMKNEFRVHQIETSLENVKDPAKKVAEKVAGLALDVIEEHLQEDILWLPKSDILNAFNGKRFIPSDVAAALVGRFLKEGKYGARDEVEKDKTRIQALPVVVIRNKSGDVLCLRRKEKNQNNPLNEKVVVWAGGHVRKEDQLNGQTLVQCALREVREELRLSLDSEELELRGAVYSEIGGERTQKHVGIIYEWKAKTDDVEVVLSRAEFFERRGTSQSGTFLPVKEVAEKVDTGKMAEEWSVEIVRGFLAKGEYEFAPRLL
jgi:predicted NUDIX family phosphoesterase